MGGPSIKTTQDMSKIKATKKKLTPPQEKAIGALKDIGEKDPQHLYKLLVILHEMSMPAIRKTKRELNAAAKQGDDWNGSDNDDGNDCEDCSILENLEDEKNGLQADLDNEEDRSADLEEQKEILKEELDDLQKLKAKEISCIVKELIKVKESKVNLISEAKRLAKENKELKQKALSLKGRPE